MEPQTSQNNSIVEKVEMAQALSGFVAASAVTTYRRRVGLRMTRGIFLYPVVAIMAAIGWYGSSSHYLTWYAGAVLAAGLWQNYNRWQEMKRGELTNTRSLGVSPLAAVPFGRFLPAKLTNWITSGDHIHRSADPLVMFAAGLLIVPHDQALGGWVMFSAVALRVFEEFKHEASWNILFDGMDAMLNGESQKAFMDHIRRGSTGPLTDPATGRQTTGAAEELAERIARNQARQAAAAAEAQEQARKPHPFTEAVNRVKEGAGAVKDSAEAIKESAGAVKEAAEAVSAVREAAAPPAADTVIIDRIHYVPFPVEPEAVTLTNGNGPEPPALTEREWDVVKGLYRDRPAAEAEKARLNTVRETWELPAPPNEGDKAT